MSRPTNTTSTRLPNRYRFWLGACALAAIALFFLWEEHEVHIMGALPYVLLLLCPALHLLMHRGHGDHEHSSSAANRNSTEHGRSGVSS